MNTNSAEKTIVEDNVTRDLSQEPGRDFVEYLQIRAFNLKEIVDAKKTELEQAPEGLLIAENRSSGPIYFIRSPEEPPKNKACLDMNSENVIHDISSTPSRLYGKRQCVKKNNLEDAQKLAQRDYDQLVLRMADDELAAINRLLGKLYKISSPESIYSELGPARKALVDPYYLPDEEYIKWWEAQSFERKSASGNIHEIFTKKFELVRSKSEKIIGDELADDGIPYRYEAALILPKTGIKIFPDFTILDIKTREEKYIEHLGMMDDSDYAAAAVRRIQEYERNEIYLGERLMITYETGDMPLNTKILKAKIDAFLGR